MLSDYLNDRIDCSRYRDPKHPVVHDFSIPFDPVLRLDARYRGIIREIRRADYLLSGMVFSDSDYRDLVIGTYSSNVHWSVNLDGNDLPVDQVRRLALLFSGGNLSGSFDDGDKAVVNHLYSLFVYFMESGHGLPWDTDRIVALHSCLRNNVEDGNACRGFRPDPMSFVNRDGKEIYVACEPSRIEEELEALLDWMNSSPYDEVITSVIFLHAFESIHPFKTGNGTTGRTLALILLQELGLKNCVLCRIDDDIFSDRDTYQTLMVYTEDTKDYAPLVMYIAESLLRSYRRTVSQFSERDLSRYMDGYMKNIVRRSKTVDEFSVSEATSWCEGITEQSVRLKLRALTDMNVLEKHGQTRSQRYRIKDPFRGVKESLLRADR